mmetsp:Transcript_37833/g.91753  ORF Transcript_37833/g.91753 Transcript_37833/m.91753 type:complete len:83 (+) Transcript_37833:45-293(+)
MVCVCDLSQANNGGPSEESPFLWHLTNWENCKFQRQDQSRKIRNLIAVPALEGLEYEGWFVCVTSLKQTMVAQVKRVPFFGT